MHYLGFQTWTLGVTKFPDVERVILATDAVKLVSQAECFKNSYKNNELMVNI